MTSEDRGMMIRWGLVKFKGTSVMRGDQLYRDTFSSTFSSISRLRQAAKLNPCEIQSPRKLIHLKYSASVFRGTYNLEEEANFNGETHDQDNSLTFKRSVHVHIVTLKIFHPVMRVHV